VPTKRALVNFKVIDVDVVEMMSWATATPSTCTDLTPPKAASGFNDNELIVVSLVRKTVMVGLLEIVSPFFKITPAIEASAVDCAVVPCVPKLTQPLSELPNLAFTLKLYNIHASCEHDVQVKAVIQPELVEAVIFSQ
jgi:hypothetical protein